MIIRWSTRSMKTLNAIQSDHFTKEETKIYRDTVIEKIEQKIRLLKKTFQSHLGPNSYVVRVDSYLAVYRFISDDEVIIFLVKHMKQLN